MSVIKQINGIAIPLAGNEDPEEEAELCYTKFVVFFVRFESEKQALAIAEDSFQHILFYLKNATLSKGRELIEETLWMRECDLNHLFAEDDYEDQLCLDLTSPEPFKKLFDLMLTNPHIKTHTRMDEQSIPKLEL
jgi:hypothetical protein